MLYYINLYIAEAPGAGGIRFNLPKRNNFNAGKAFQNQGPGKNQQQNNNNSMQSGDDQSKENDVTSVLRGTPPPPPASPSLEPDPEDKGKSPPTTGNANPMQSGEWPPSLKLYVSRAFNSVTREADRDVMEHMLKEKLTMAFNAGQASTIDWDNEPLPLEGMVPKTRYGLAISKKTRWDLGITESPREITSPRGGFRGRGRGRGFQDQRQGMLQGRQGLYQGRRRSPAGYRRPRSRSRSRSRSYSRSRSRSRSRSPRRDRDRRDRHRTRERAPRFRDLGSDSDSSRSNSTSPPRRKSFVDKRIPVKGRGRGRGKDKLNAANKLLKKAGKNKKKG